MSRVGPRDTHPEVTVRKALFSAGFRFRKNVKTLPGSPDIVLAKYRAIVFVHGCFWHQHPGCRKARRPSSNVSFWDSKFERNIKRDKSKLTELVNLGWTVFVIWQCEIDREPKSTLDKLVSSLSPSQD